MIYYYQNQAGAYKTAKSIMPKPCKSMASKYNWLMKNIQQLNDMNKDYLENDKIVIHIESTDSPFRVYLIQLYRQHHRLQYLMPLEQWDNRDAL